MKVGVPKNYHFLINTIVRPFIFIASEILSFNKEGDLDSIKKEKSSERFYPKGHEEQKTATTFNIKSSRIELQH